jgi:hypothetical protein
VYDQPVARMRRGAEAPLSWRGAVDAPDAGSDDPNMDQHRIGEASNVRAEAEDLRSRAEFAAEWQATAVGFWSNVELVLGSLAAGLAAISSGTAFSDQKVIAGSLAAVAALAAAVLAALRPGERSHAHKKAADEFHALAVDLRLFGKFGAADAVDALEQALRDFEARAVNVTRSAPWAPRRLEKRTKEFWASGRRFYDNKASDGGQGPDAQLEEASASRVASGRR